MEAWREKRAEYLRNYRENKASQRTKEENEKRALYMREWRKRNKEKVAEYNKKYWSKKAEGGNEWSKSNQEENINSKPAHQKSVEQPCQP